MRALTLATCLIAAPAWGQDLRYGGDRVSSLSYEPSTFSFRSGLGAQSAPLYFGSDEQSTGVTGSFEFGHLRAFGRCFGCDDTPGFGATGSFRYIGARDGGDGPEFLLPDGGGQVTAVDAAVELGGGLSYSSDTVEAFAVVRRGFGGHDGWVAELGGDLILRPSEAVTVKLGPRLLAGDDTFVQTYFNAARGGGFAGPFVAEAGVVSRGIAISATYDVTDIWGVTASARFEQLLNDAAASPISVSDDQTTLSLVITRQFDW